MLDICPTKINVPIAITAPGVEYPSIAILLVILTIGFLKYFAENTKNIDMSIVKVLVKQDRIIVLNDNLKILSSKK